MENLDEETNGEAAESKTSELNVMVPESDIQAPPTPLPPNVDDRSSISTENETTNEPIKIHEWMVTNVFGERFSPRYLDACFAGEKWQAMMRSS